MFLQPGRTGFRILLRELENSFLLLCGNLQVSRSTNKPNYKKTQHDIKAWQRYYFQENDNDPTLEAV